MSGELAQLGADIGDGCAAALGTGLLQVVFDPAEPLGLGLGPLVPSDRLAYRDSKKGRHASVGMGVEVGEVDAGGVAERAGVKPGMSLLCLSDPLLVLRADDGSEVSFEAALTEMDRRRALGQPLMITFATDV